jgi:hypothetical protein
MVEQLALGVRGRLAINLEHDVRRVEIRAWSQQPSQCPSACGARALVPPSGKRSGQRRSPGVRALQGSVEADAATVGADDVF